MESLFPFCYDSVPTQQSLRLEIVAGFWSLTKGHKSWCSNAQFDSFQKTGSHVWRRETKSFSH